MANIFSFNLIVATQQEVQMNTNCLQINKNVVYMSWVDFNSVMYEIYDFYNLEDMKKNFSSSNHCKKKIAACY